MYDKSKMTYREYVDRLNAKRDKLTTEISDIIDKLYVPADYPGKRYDELSSLLQVKELALTRVERELKEL